MRYDHVRRVLVVVVAGLLFLPATLLSQQQDSTPAWLISRSGAVTVKRPGAAEGVLAQINSPIEEGSEVSTSDGAFAVVKIENGSTIRLDELTKANLTQLSADIGSDKIDVITLEQGHAGFHYVPEQKDILEVKIANATLSPHGRAQFQTAFVAGKMQVRVLAGTITVSAHSGSLTLRKGMGLEYDPSVDAEVAKSHARVVRLSYASGAVMLKRPGSTEAERAMLNTPIQEGFELSTASSSYAEVEFENGSTARLGELSELLFQQLALNANGSKLNGTTLEQGYATFHFLPGHSSPSQHERNGTIQFKPGESDVYRVKIADATVTADGKCEFRTDLIEDRYRVEVFTGLLNMSTSTMSSSLGAGKVLERKPGATESASNIQKGIVNDDWDQWTEARDKQALLTERDEAVHPNGPSYGWSDLNAYGEWVTLPSGRFGWSPYARAGWSPYTSGRWEWYPGMGWVWVSAEPWGWVTDHCGLWDFDTSFGWYWMNPMFGCGFWEPSLVNWYAGSGWIGWRPGRPQHGPPGHPRPGPRPLPGHATAEIIRVPAAVLQNRQMITPQIVSHIPAPPGTMIAQPPFEPNPRTGPESNTAAPTLAATSEHGFTSRPATAPPTILMGGDAAKESLLLANHGFRSGHTPLRAAQGTTLGGRYALAGSPGEFRGNASIGGGGNAGAGGISARAGGPVISHASGGSGGAIVASHGSAGGVSGSAGSGFSGGGGHASAGGGGAPSGGSVSASSSASAGGGGHH